MLPYVIGQADANTNTAGSEIEFDLPVFASPRTITLAGTLVLSEAAGPEVIDGPGASLVAVGVMTAKPHRPHQLGRIGGSRRG